MAYLAHSPYGRNGNEITINNGINNGNAGDSISATVATGTIYEYNTTEGMLASTTGNITGIYDMSGGKFEYVAAWNKNSTSSNLSDGKSFATQGGSSTKYATAYNGDDSSEPSSSKCIVGDATYEVQVSSYKAWFSDTAGCASSSRPFFIRGGNNESTTNAGVFYSTATSGGFGRQLSFRVCLPGV